MNRAAYRGVMSISNSYLVLSEKNINTLKNLSLDVEDLLRFARNKDLNLYIRIEKLLPNNFKTEFNQSFELTRFLNSKLIDRYSSTLFSVADYNIDIGKPLDNDGIGRYYSESENLKMIQFDGFIQIPNRMINESEQKIILDGFSPYRFLESESGLVSLDFILNFSFPNDGLEVPIRNIYILASDIYKLAENKLITIPKSEDEQNNENTRLKSQNAELQARISELENKVQQSAVDSEPVLGNAKAYDVRERETHLLIIGALSNLLAESKRKYQKGNGGINQSAISKDIETEIIELLQPATKTRTIDTIRPRIRESLNLITKAE